MLAVETFILDYLIAFTEQFLERAEYCAPFYEKYFTENLLIKYKQPAFYYEGLKRNIAKYQQAKNMVNSAAIVDFMPVIQSVDVQGESAIIITSEHDPLMSKHEHHCYHLLNTAMGWKIDRNGIECFSCKGTGIDTILGKEGGQCSYCEGLGWRYYGPSK